VKYEARDVDIAEIWVVPTDSGPDIEAAKEIAETELDKYVNKFFFRSPCFAHQYHLMSGGYPYLDYF
jgi:hypothetical protein